MCEEEYGCKKKGERAIQSLSFMLIFFGERFMKKFLIVACVLVFAVFAYFSLRHVVPMAGLPTESRESFAIQNHLQTFHPIQEDKSFAIVILGENAEASCERQLRSIFNQTYETYQILYIDNGSNDQTAAKVKALCEKENKIDRLTLIRHEQKKADMQVIYDVIHGLNPQDIVVYLEGQDWLSHENVLDHLNCAYAHPDVWLTYSRVIRHPDYQNVEGKAFSDGFLQGKKFREKGVLPLPSLVTFPVAYFKEIRLEDLLFNGHFIAERAALAFLYPLLEMGPDHVLFMDEVMLVKNDTTTEGDHKEHLHQLMAIESYLRSLRPYPTLSQLKLTPPSQSTHRLKGDVLIFSEDSPLHLYACLESLYLKVRDINEIYVIYQSRDHAFGRAYLNLKNEFPTVQFLDVCDYPGNDFESLLTKTLSNKRYGAPYVLITDDHYVFEQKLMLHDCITSLEKVHANHFFLNLDEKVVHHPLPEAIQITEGTYAWQLGEVGQKQSPFMCISRKAVLEEGLALHQVQDLAAFKQLWKKQLPSHSVALFFEEKKALPLKLEKEETLTQKKDWGTKFNEGYKIDLPSLLCEVDEVQGGDYPLIKRERRKIGLSQ